MNLENEKFITGLKILSPATAQVIVIVKKYRKDGIAAIKKDVVEQRYVLRCSSTDSEAYDCLIACYDELMKNGFIAEIYENDEKQNIQHVRNWAESMHETARYINSDDLLE